MDEAKLLIAHYRVIQVPCVFWKNKAATESRKKKSACGYEIVLELQNGQIHKDRMLWLDSGQGRDCFKLENHRLCLKWFWETDNVEYKKLHADELKCWNTFKDSAVGCHLPVVYGCSMQTVQGQQCQVMEVDCLLTDFVGQNLKTVIDKENAQWGPRSPERLKRLFIEMVRMCQRAQESGLKWQGDFHSRNICWDEQTGRWYFVDLETAESQDEKFEVAAHKAAKRQASDLESFKKANQCQAEDFWIALLHQCLFQKHHSGISMTEIEDALLWSEAGQQVRQVLYSLV